MGKQSDSITKDTAGAATGTHEDTAPVKAQDFMTMPIAKLEKVDFGALSAEDKDAYTACVSKHLFDAKNHGALVLKNGTTYVGGQTIGSVAQPQSLGNVIPTVWKGKQEWARTDGSIAVPAKNVVDGIGKVRDTFLTAARILMAAVDGNGIHMLGQRGKTDDNGNAAQKVANALAPHKGKIA
jgi:hypothetical protein